MDYEEDGRYDEQDSDYSDDPEYDPEEGPYYNDDDDLIDGVGFAAPGGESALRAETPSNPRNLPCPQCGEEDRLTPKDRARGYCCDSCARQNEGGGY